MSATKKNIKTAQSPKSQKTPTKPKEKTPKKVVQDVVEAEVDEGEQMNIVNDNVPSNAIAPQHSLRIRYKSRKLIVRVTLHKIPDQCLKFEPTSTHFYLDTFKFSKKFYLHFRYPRDIEVDAENVDATLEYGILTAIFPITHITDLHEGEEQSKPKHNNKRKQDDAQLKSKQANKKQKTENGAVKTEKNNKNDKKPAQHIKEEVTPVKQSNSNESKKQNKPVKKSEDAMDLDESHNEHTETTTTKTNKKTVKKEQSNGSAKKTQPQKTVDEHVADDTEEQPQEKKKKPKNFVNESVMLDIADQINDAEDKKRDSKINKQESKQKFFEQQAKKKEEKKQKQAALKKQVLDQVMNKKKQVQQDEEELANKVVTRRVSFGDSVKDNEKTAKTGKAANKKKGSK